MAKAESLSEDEYISSSLSSDYEVDEDYDSIYFAKKEIEYFDYECFSVEMAERFLNVRVEALCKELDIPPVLAKMLLHFNEWNQKDIVRRYKTSPEQLLISSHLKAPASPNQSTYHHLSHICQVCTEEKSQSLISLKDCNHYFCRECWDKNFQVQINRGLSTRIECMATSCDVYVPEDFVEQYLSSGPIKEIYQRRCFIDHVESHPELQLCPGQNCSVIVSAQEKIPKRVTCNDCNTSFCFSCRMHYHAPTKCDIIKKWWTKCADDSETANYISANTKDCPKCLVVIEKNGGCNHVHCVRCNYDFCWMCHGDWKNHGSEYYECSRYKENPNIVNETQAQAREALKKYLFYFERYENHKKSLLLEEQARTKIQEHIHERVKDKNGTWIDWQYLLKAFDRLKMCRYTLQYTYPYAYYLDKSDKKDLYEGWQAQLEVEVENLSWKIEHAEKEEHAVLANQMTNVEIRRQTLLRDFFETQCF